jgi:hypothetical protein
MPDYIVLKRTVLSGFHSSTGQTRHYRGEQELPAPKSLEIVRYPDTPGYYLLYLDEEGKWLTDTYHDTIENAIDQATWEFKVGRDEWVDVPL